jgi:formylglycine-generating enzyme required for sulfatase activity
MNDLLVKQFGFTSFTPGPILGAMATKDAIGGAIRSLTATSRPTDDVVFIFVGHGIASDDGRSGFLVPYEGNRDLRSNSDTLIPLTPLLQDLSKLRARHVLVILDSCHSGQAVPLTLESQPTTDATRPPDTRLARVVLASASPYDSAIAEGQGGKYTTFSGALIDVLETGSCDLSDDGYCTGTEVGLLVRRKVLSQSKSLQTPMVGPFQGDENADFRFELAASVKSRWIKAKQEEGTLKEQRDRVQRFLDENPEGAGSTLAGDRYIRRYRQAAERRESDLVLAMIEQGQPVQLPSLSAVPAGKNNSNIIIDATDQTQYRWIPPGTLSHPEGEGASGDKKAVEGFWMADREVTVGAFKDFLNKDLSLLPKAPAFNRHWEDPYPMVNVSWRTADLYCKLRGARLPTRDEWKYAAQAGIESGLPWWNKNTTPNYANIEGFREGRFPMPVTEDDSAKGNRRNDWNLFDMLGNVNEWTSESTPAGVWVAGGSFANTWDFIKNSSNWFSLSEPLGSNTVGFRCIAEPSRML